MGGWGAEIAGVDSLVNTTEEIADGLENVTWVVGTNVKYSIFVEYGTRDMAPNRGMRLAVRETKREADAIADRVDTTDELVRQIALRIEERWKYHIQGGGPSPERVDTGNYLRSVRAVPL